MNLKHWRHFLAVADAQSFTRAAEHLGVPQPVLSREMRELEMSLGVTLFSRHARGVALNPAGDVFRKRVEAILRDIERVPEEVAASKNTLTGKLSLGVPPSMASLLIAPLVERFRNELPQIRLHLREGTSTDIRNGLLARELDLGILSTPLIEPQLRLDPLIDEPMVLIGPPGSGLNPSRAVSLEEVAARPLILATRPNSVRIVLEHALESIGLTPTIVIETDNAPLGHLVRRGIAYSIMPSCYVARRREGLEYAPVRDLWVGWSIATLRALPLAPPAQHMAKLIKELVDAHGDWDLWYDKRLRRSLRTKNRSR